MLLLKASHIFFIDMEYFENFFSYYEAAVCFCEYIFVLLMLCGRPHSLYKTGQAQDNLTAFYADNSVGYRCTLNVVC